MVPGRHRPQLPVDAPLHFLGRVDPPSPSVYLTITEDLLKLAGQRFQGLAPKKVRNDRSGASAVRFFEDHLKTQKGLRPGQCEVIGTQ